MFLSRAIISVLSFLACCQLLAQGFTNIAHQYGIDQQYHTIEYGGGLSFVDFNQDGMDDLTFATENGKSLLFFLNTGSGFEQIPALVDDTSVVKQVIWVDYNNDGELDLYIAGESSNRLYRNDGNLSLIDVTSMAGFDFPQLTTYSSTWFDYNSDGRLDLVVSHRTEDKDGWIDLYRNIDYISFEKETIRAGLTGKGTSVLAMTILDYNNDGWQDLFLGQDWDHGNQLLRNNGNGTFMDVSMEAGIDYKMNSMTGTVMDINQDGWQDIYVTNTTQGNILLINEGDGRFTEQSEAYNLNISTVTFGTVFFDADNDGDDDVHIGGLKTNFTMECNDDHQYIKRNIDWGMQLDQQFNNGVAIGDFDGNGYIDIAKNSVSRQDVYTSFHALWKNQFSDNNYVKIDLEGTISNRFGIGSRIQVHTGDKVQLKRVACGESFSSQHTLTTHFGVGATELIDSIIVFWPSGNRTLFEDVHVNQKINIIEPKLGCMDSNACNFSPFATESNGTCRYPEQFYNCHGCISDSDGDGICDELEILGCDDPLSCNYSPEATENDGSCEYLETAEIIGSVEVVALEEVEYQYKHSNTSSYAWYIENGSIVLGNGTSTIRVLWYDLGSGKLEVQETNQNGCTGIRTDIDVLINEAQPYQNLNIQISPNPVQNTLQITGINQEVNQLSIYDMAGKLRFVTRISEPTMAIDVRAYSTGCYILRLEGENMQINEKFCKQ